MEMYTLDKPEFQEVPIKIENNFFIDTRFSSQSEIKRGKSVGILRKQQLDSIFDLQFGFPLRNNIVYGTELVGINSKSCKKNFKQ